MGCSFPGRYHGASVLRGRRYACSPEELLKGPKSVASSAPCAQYREPISLEDVVEKHQR